VLQNFQELISIDLPVRVQRKLGKKSNAAQHHATRKLPIRESLVLDLDRRTVGKSVAAIEKNELSVF